MSGLVWAWIDRLKPTVASIVSAVGDSAGGDTVVIAGTSFRTGATVTIGGVSCTSVVVDSAIQITCVTGAHAQGAVDVVVTNTNGSSSGATGAGLYTYFDAVGNSTLLLEKGNYVDAGAGAGTWTARVGTNAATASTAPAAVAAAPDIVTSKWLDVAADTNTFLGTTGDFFIDAVVVLDSITSTNASEGEAVIADRDASAYFGLYVVMSGELPHGRLMTFNGAGIKKAQVQLSASTGRHHIQAKNVSGQLSIRVNGGSWVTGDTGGAISASAANMYVGRSSGGIYLDGRIYLIRLATSMPANSTEEDVIAAWATARFP